MSAPVITFYTGSQTTGNTPPSGAFNMSALGAMASVFDFGIIDTGSSGSNTWFWIWNNIAGQAGISDAILSSSTVNLLGLGHHESGSTNHITEGTYAWSLQSGSFTGSVWVISNYYVKSGAGSVYNSGALATGWNYIFSGSSGRRLEMPGGGVLSGSQGLGGKSGSGWLIGCYIRVANNVPQGSKTGSFCVKFQYV